MIKSVTIIGTWRKVKAKKAKFFADEIGRILAKENMGLISGAGTGISEYVVNAYRQYGGQKYTAYLVAPKYMKEVGEKLGPKPDKIIKTKVDYPERNLIMTRDTELAIALTGNLGTLEEIIFNAKDYHHPVIVIDGFPIAKMVKALPDLKKRVIFVKDVQDIERAILRASKNKTL
ncbi:MAG: hypothetical protein ABH884_04215 [Candidatus Komeilibacteria bacterium]